MVLLQHPTLGSVRHENFEVCVDQRNPEVGVVHEGSIAFLALAQVAKRQQAAHFIGDPSTNLLEKLFVLLRPDPQVRTLVQAKHPGLAHFGVNSH